jgi:hypothetical protein
VIFAAGVVIALLIASFTFLFLRLASRLDANACGPEWLDEFSVENYAPMERLLDASDFEYLARQPGYQPKTGKHLLTERRKIFCEYLSLLMRDFNQLHFIAKLLLVHSPEDRPELARTLWRQQLTFYFAVCVIRFKVAVYPWGWTAVDVPKLLHGLEHMRGQIQASALPPIAGGLAV